MTAAKILPQCLKTQCQIRSISYKLDFQLNGLRYYVSELRTLEISVAEAFYNILSALNRSFLSNDLWWNDSFLSPPQTDS